MKRLLVIIAISVITSLCYTRTAFPIDPVILSPDKLSGQYIGLSIEYLEDKEKKLSVENITSKEYASKFIASTKERPGFGISTSAFWLRFQVSNPEKYDINWYLEYDYPFVKGKFFIPQKDGKFLVKNIDINTPASKREINHFNNIWHITEKPGIRTYYLYIHNTGTLDAPLRAWSPNHFINNFNTLFIILTFICSVMIVMFIYNLFVFISVRELGYFFYLLTIAAFLFLLVSINGVGYSYIFGNLPNAYKEYLIPVSIPLSHIAVMLFMRVYLATKKNIPRLDKIILFLIIIESLLLIYTLFALTPHNTSALIGIFNLTGLIDIFFILFVMGPVYIKLKLRPAAFFYSAYIALFIGFTMRTLKDLGAISPTFLAHYGGEFGTICMVLLFSLGLADKINTMKNELADLNKNLEQKVIDRTAELHAAMEELEAMNQNLRNTMEELEMTNEKLVQTRDALWGEMQLAKKIQTVLLPVDPQMNGYAISAYMETADEVGGDYYDLIHEGGKDWIVIGDVSGHGVPAGLVMMMVQTAIHTALSNNGDLSPSRLLTNINRTITENIQRLGENKYMTITVFACIDGGTFHFAGLHQDIMIYRANKQKVEMISTNGMWIGLFDDLTGMISDNQFNLDSGDVVLLYTDGITEARDESDAMYGESRLVNLLEQYGPNGPDRVKGEIINSLQQYKKSDDISMMIFKKL